MARIQMADRCPGCHQPFRDYGGRCEHGYCNRCHTMSCPRPKKRFAVDPEVPGELRYSGLFIRTSFTYEKETEA